MGSKSLRQWLYSFSRSSLISFQMRRLTSDSSFIGCPLVQYHYTGVTAYSNIYIPHDQGSTISWLNILKNYPMSKTPLAHQRMSRIIGFSMDYKKHREMLRQIKNRSDLGNYKKRGEKLALLVEQRNRYKSAVKREGSTKLKRENQGIVQRLFAIGIRSSRPRLPLSRTNSVSSIRSLSLSCQVVNNNNPSRKSQCKVKKKENPEADLSAKLQKSQLKGLGLIIPSRQYRSSNEYKEYKKSIRRFSQKNKNIRTSILEKGLKLQKEYYAFLPNVTKSRSPKTKNQSKKVHA